MTDLKATGYWPLFADIVNALKYLLPPSGTEAYWQEATELLAGISRRYDPTPQRDLCTALLHALLEELTRLAEEGQR